MVLAGDLYDGDWKDFNTGLFFNRQMHRLAEAGIRVLVVSGNHDAASHITRSLRPPDNVHLFDTRHAESVVLEEFGVIVHGQGFPTRAVTEDLSRGYPRAEANLFNIGVLHTSLDGRPGHEAYAPCTLDGLRSKGYQYWALGHIHRREIVSEDPWIVFPGNTQGRHARETGPKGCTLVTVQNGLVQSVEHRAVDAVRWEIGTVHADGLVTLDEVLDRAEQVLASLAERGDGRLVAARLRISGACAINSRLRAQRERFVNEIRALASGSAAGDLWVEKVVIETVSRESSMVALARDDAFGSLLRAIRDLEHDQGKVAVLAGEVADLRNKLPHQLTAADDGFDPTSPEALMDSLEDVKQMILEKLLAGAPGE